MNKFCYTLNKEVSFLPKVKIEAPNGQIKRLERIACSEDESCEKLEITCKWASPTHRFDGTDLNNLPLEEAPPRMYISSFIPLANESRHLRQFIRRRSLPTPGFISKTNFIRTVWL
jgi:hypothetical protein